jgi:hypothetical protein
MNIAGMDAVNTSLTMVLRKYFLSKGRKKK